MTARAREPASEEGGKGTLTDVADMGEGGLSASMHRRSLRSKSSKKAPGAIERLKRLAALQSEGVRLTATLGHA